MNEKLEQVTRTLYEQGVEKGKIRAAEMVEEAKKEAEKLLLEAEQKAKLLLEEARDQSAQIHAATLIELRLKTDLTVAELSKRLSIQLTEQLLFEGDSRAVLQKLMCTVVEQLTKEIKNTSHNDLALGLPSQWEEVFDQPLRAALESLLSEGIAVTFHDSATPSIAIEHLAGKYTIQVDDVALRTFFISHLSERTRRYLGF